ncbi:glucuronosyltransferase [Sphingobium amiense]|uniref:Glucuronosyltransferase n=1 Tax=Sphingobium amiense TaxID=135719 RepID=A0A494W559_9SPHN|nr:glycosyltransferase [Sphingobium amiense]BBD99723.1 glucuronosyltransferase [Sphingobium amiense]
MIFVTVGTQLPFDRLIELIDAMAPSLDEEVFAQTGRGRYQPVNVQSSALLKPRQFDELVTGASRIVSHAGIGTVLMAQKYRKPVILFPRRASLGEHRNDHQLATVAALRGREGIYVAESDEELGELLRADLVAPEAGAPHPGRDRLRERIADFISGGPA